MILSYIDSSAGLVSLFIGGIIVTAIFLGIFLLIRSIMLWYWKVDIIVNNQQQQSILLQQLTQLIQQQNKLLAEKKSQEVNEPKAN